MLGEILYHGALRMKFTAQILTKYVHDTVKQSVVFHK